jgi:hypothetical protein
MGAYLTMARVALDRGGTNEADSNTLRTERPRGRSRTSGWPPRSCCDAARSGG